MAKMEMTQEERKYYVTDKVKKNGYVANFPEHFFSVVTPIIGIAKNKYNQVVSVIEEDMKIYVGDNEINRDYVLESEVHKNVLRQLILAEVIK
jgi:hypothetical protein